MPHAPFPAIAVAEKLRHGHVKHAPALKPDPAFAGVAIGALEQRHDAVALGVHAFQPLVGGLFVVLAAHPPVVGDLHVFLKMHQQVL